MSLITFLDPPPSWKNGVESLVISHYFCYLHRYVLSLNLQPQFSPYNASTPPLPTLPRQSCQTSVYINCITHTKSSFPVTFAKGPQESDRTIINSRPPRYNPPARFEPTCPASGAPIPTRLGITRTPLITTRPAPALVVPSRPAASCTHNRTKGQQMLQQCQTQTRT